jgi:hypothetical protein
MLNTSSSSRSNSDGSVADAAEFVPDPAHRSPVQGGGGVYPGSSIVPSARTGTESAHRSARAASIRFTVFSFSI